MTSPTVRLRRPGGVEVAHYPPGATFGPRVLGDFEFVWLLRGSAYWQCQPIPADHQRSAQPVATAHALTLHPGMLLLARPGMADHFAWDRDQPSVHAYVHFHVDDPRTLGPFDQWPVVRSLSAADPLASLCRYLLWLGGTDAPRAATRTPEVLGWILDLFVGGPVAEEVDAGLPQHIVRVLDHVRATWRSGGARSMSLAEMAAAAGISPGHLARVFAQRFGVGPVTAVELIRLARAAILLHRSNLTIGAIADVCGFANPFHFSRRFRSIYGAAPRAYRNRQAQHDPLDPVGRAGLLPLAHQLLVEDL